MWVGVGCVCIHILYQICGFPCVVCVLFVCLVPCVNWARYSRVQFAQANRRDVFKFDLNNKIPTALLSRCKLSNMFTKLRVFEAEEQGKTQTLPFQPAAKKSEVTIPAGCYGELCK